MDEVSITALGSWTDMDGWLIVCASKTHSTFGAGAGNK